ncbi:MULTISPECIES: hypothetical protein [Asaia]|uniref:Uncharacterized protein n=1 Tax=Asaia spathodeae TaxID=657016 RepID=A0ABX2P842_9PROT|nr:hypothetical protein [Asaia spathodeae]GBR20186.1 hypothetical protein AA105894_2495 [Asaia spathodeae NBRC 105894]
MSFFRINILIVMASLLLGLGWVIAPEGARLIWIMIAQASFLGLALFTVIVTITRRAEIDRTTALRLILLVPLWLGLGLLNLAFADTLHKAWLP